MPFSRHTIRFIILAGALIAGSRVYLFIPSSTVGPAPAAVRPMPPGWVQRFMRHALGGIVTCEYEMRTCVGVRVRRTEFDYGPYYDVTTAGGARFLGIWHDQPCAAIVLKHNDEPEIVISVEAFMQSQDLPWQTIVVADARYPEQTYKGLVIQSDGWTAVCLGPTSKRPNNGCCIIIAQTDSVNNALAVGQYESVANSKLP